MIRVTCDPQGYAMTVEGHSGSAPKGEDLICSASTILTLTLVELVETVCAEKQTEIRDGYAMIRGDRKAAQYLDFARTGFRMLAEMEPEHVVCVDRYE